MHCVPAGSGCIPIADIVRDLVATGYTGWLTIEQYGSRQMLSDSQAAYENVRNLL
jgi:sugar phosphate isomerase/epimerase